MTASESLDSGAPSTLDKLVYQANQISRFFAAKPGHQAVADTADHIAKFWDPRMRQLIIAHVRGGGLGLEPIALAAVRSLLQAAP